MNIFELTAIGQYLSYWDENLSYKQILEEIRQDFENELDIDIQDYYHGVDGQWLCDCIDDLKATLERNFKPKEGIL